MMELLLHSDLEETAAVSSDRSFDIIQLAFPWIVFLLFHVIWLI